VGVASVTVSLADETAAKKAAAKAPSMRKQKLDACIRYPKLGSVDVGEQLLVVNDEGQLVDVKVTAVAGVQADVVPLRDGVRAPFKIALDRTPHASLNFVESASEFLTSLEAYRGRVLKARGVMQDAITGVNMKTAEQLISLTIDMGADAAGRGDTGLQYADYEAVADIKQLAALTSSRTPARHSSLPDRARARRAAPRSSSTCSPKAPARAPSCPSS